jgi:hypothetical protein
MTRKPASASSPPALPAHPGGGAAQDVDEHRLAAVRRRLAEGYYQRSEVLERLAEALGPELPPPQ